jgi:hypothetical protein
LDNYLRINVCHGLDLGDGSGNVLFSEKNQILVA